MPDLITTPGAANANAFADLDDAEEWFDSRAPLSPVWAQDTDGNERYMVMSTRVIQSSFLGRKMLVRDKRGNASGIPYYVTQRRWTGSPASDTQALAWPRKGMYDSLGRAIPENVIPVELVQATCELAGQLRNGDRTLDNDVKVQGITSVRAGSVAVSFKDDIDTQVIPDAVFNMMPPSWFTDEIVTQSRIASLDSLG